MPKLRLRQIVSAIVIPSAPPWRRKAQVCTGTWNTSWQRNAVICHQTCPRQCWSRKPTSRRTQYLSYLRMSSTPRLKAGGSNHQLYKGNGLNKVRSSASSVSIWESSVAKTSMLIMCLNLWEEQGRLTVFLCSMQPNHKFSNRRAVGVGDSEEEDEEEAKLHERENELEILQEILSKKLG